MASINILKFPVASPADTSSLGELKRAGYAPSQILAVVGKAEGNGCVNDFSRTLSTVVWEPLIPSDAVTVFSGGTEGVLSPHVTFIVKESRPTGLLAVASHTRILQPWEIGTVEHAKEVEKTVGKMMKDVGVTDRAEVKLVLIKCPLLTSAKIEEVKATGRVPPTADTYESMALSRRACAIGVGAAVGEIEEEALGNAAISTDQWSSVASCSSGAELEDCHILLLASDHEAEAGHLRAISTVMKDAIDAPVILKALREIEEANGQIVQVFAKAEADPRGQIRGNRHTMNTDSDLHSTRHARAAVGGLLAGLTGDTQIYVSGGAEGQGPPGGGSLVVVYRV
jgi:cyanuric acid amidohydrolase